MLYPTQKGRSVHACSKAGWTYGNDRGVSRDARTSASTTGPPQHAAGWRREAPGFPGHHSKTLCGLPQKNEVSGPRLKKGAVGRVSVCGFVCLCVCLFERGGYYILQHN